MTAIEHFSERGPDFKTAAMNAAGTLEKRELAETGEVTVDPGAYYRWMQENALQVRSLNIAELMHTMDAIARTNAAIITAIPDVAAQGRHNDLAHVAVTAANVSRVLTSGIPGEADITPEGLQKGANYEAGWGESEGLLHSDDRRVQMRLNDIGTLLGVNRKRPEGQITTPHPELQERHYQTTMPGVTLVERTWLGSKPERLTFQGVSSIYYPMSVRLFLRLPEGQQGSVRVPTAPMPRAAGSRIPLTGRRG